MTDDEQPIEAALARARAHSPYLKRQSDSFPLVTNALQQGSLADAILFAKQAGEDCAHIAASLRRERNALSLALAIGDLCGGLSFEQTVGQLSAFADRALERALAEAMADRVTKDESCGFAILALGKLGSLELNYSSDIDLLFLFDPAIIPLKAREDPSQAAVRIGRRVIEILQKRDEDGFVFRVDMRLRPSPEITPIALPVNAAISHYESSALPWERAAFIRARAVAGDPALGRYFLDAIHPFIWRRSLDFGAIGEIRNITHRIRDHFSQGQIFGPGYDLKRGRGGIRELEFFVQIHQLIHGGREPELRPAATLDALAALSSAGRIPSDDAALLADAYRLFRTIEHRLQMVDDKQTHNLPAAGPMLDNVAQLHGVVDGRALLDLLAGPVACVEALYDRLAGTSGQQMPHDTEALEAELCRLGLPDVEAARLRIEGWRSGKARSLRTSPARAAFEAMLPGIIQAFAQAPDPIAAMNRFDELVTRMPSGLNFYRLLEARPELAEVLATILSHAPALAEQLGRRPELLDGLISQSAFAPPPSVSELIAAFAKADRGDEDYQLLLDRVRRRVNEWRFALGTQLVTARSDPVDVAAGYARVAEAALCVLTDAAVAEFERSHGRVPGSELLILGLGRLGGERLTHASDLDLIYLFTGEHGAQSDAARPMGATDYFNRLAKRVTAALNVATAAGPLYDVDTRLRPSGEGGLLAVSLSSFANYQRDSAWVWEHMALTRARPVYGSATGRAALQQIVQNALSHPRDTAKLIADAVTMRAEMARHKPPAGPFDIKLGEGGLVDLEFAIQMLQLRHRTALVPQLECAIDALIEAGLLASGIAGAHDLLTRILVTLRLVSPDSAIPPPASRQLVAKACLLPDWETLLIAHDSARASIARLWREVTGQKGG